MTDLVPDSAQRGLSFQDGVCHTECVLWHVCEGSPKAAPCTCVWEKSENRHDCTNCPLICRERRAPEDPNGGEWKDFRELVEEGRQLAQVRVSQPDDAAKLPVFIPDRTNQISVDVPLPLDWAALNAKSLFRRGTPESPGGAGAALTNPEGVRPRFNLDSSCKLLAVLHGKDDALERFWGSKRQDFYRLLEEHGFSAATGPTFSINRETEGHLASHNLVMLFRHNRVLQELSKTPLTAVPNLYWRNDSYRKRWVNWLDENDSVSVVSRDFSRTKQLGPFWDQFEGFLGVLEGVERPLHAVLVGVGRAKARRALRALSTVDATGTVVTSEPVMKGINGRVLRYRGVEPPTVAIGNRHADGSELAVHNLQVMARHLEAVTRRIDTYRPRDRNGALHDPELEVEIEQGVEDVASGVVGHTEKETP